ncbi:MAG: DMT family transporter [Myxococcota bacterium]
MKTAHGACILARATRVKGQDGPSTRATFAWRRARQPPSSCALVPYLQIHAAVVLWGFTAILGKAIQLPALPLVWWRMLLVSVCLALWPPVWRELRRMRPRLVLSYAGIGVILGLHWLTFYTAIKWSNASVGATCIATGPVFLAFVEPWIRRRGFASRELWIGLLGIAGVALVVDGAPSGMGPGIAIGILSALIVTFFGVFNKQLIDAASAVTVLFIEITAGTLFLSLFIPFSATWPWPETADLGMLFALSFGCTLVPMQLSLRALRHLSTFSVQLSVNLEPVYAVVLGALLFGEHLTLGFEFYLGVLVLLAAVLGDIPRRAVQGAKAVPVN